MAGNGAEDGRKGQAEEEKQRDQLIFDACKHFTTLAAAAAVLVLAVFRDSGIGYVGASASLTFFGASLASCAYGVLVMATAWLPRRRRKDRTDITLTATLLLRFGVISFLLGLLWAVLNYLYRA